MKNVSVVIVSPALADANNGNWQTARRWQRMLTHHHKVRVVRHWPDTDAQDDDAMLALHARRSAMSIAAWARAHGPKGLGVVLTGTDLYRDIAVDDEARRSLDRQTCWWSSTNLARRACRRGCAQRPGWSCSHAASGGNCRNQVDTCAR